MFTLDFDGELNAIYVEDVSDNCCKPRRVKCDYLETTRTGKDCKCISLFGRVVCDEEGEKYTCSALKQYVRERAKLEANGVEEKENTEKDPKNDYTVEVQDKVPPKDRNGSRA